MYTHSENETWLIERGDKIIGKKTKLGLNSLTELEHLIYCVWVVDYSIRNAGDLSATEDLYAPFKKQGRTLAEHLKLDKLCSFFILDAKMMTENYFQSFEEICTELMVAENQN